MDFTLVQYKALLNSLIGQGYAFQSFEEFLKLPASKVIILRHDVDLLPANSLAFARIQAAQGIRGTYYFRAVPESWDENIIREISALGHEIGYHYECLTICNGNMEKAIADFEKNLAALRRLVPVNTICMHGSPMSKYDSKDLWKDYDYRKYGIKGEPYFDVDFKNVFYLTDTGRRWDGDKVSVRDKVKITGHDLCFHSTGQIVAAANNVKLPEQIMFTFHPQRWNDDKILWMKELILQNIKNLVKRFLVMKQ